MQSEQVPMALGELFGPQKCEHGDCCEPAWFVFMTQEEYDTAKSQEELHPINYVFANKIGTALCDLHGVSMNSDKTKPLPCPFCGATADKLKHSDLYRIQHYKTCWFSGKDFSQRASLIEPDEVEQWNRRATPELICRKCSLRQDAVLNQDNDIPF